MKSRRRDRIAVVHELHDGLQVPERYRAEIVEGMIALSTAPSGMHLDITQSIRASLAPASPEDYRLYENATIEEPDGDRYIPDLVAMPRKAVGRLDARWVFPGGICLFVVEVTSPDHEEHDYKKAAEYVRSGIAVYLLVDQKRRICVVHSDPRGSVYTTVRTEPFGNPVDLPLDETVRVETSDF